MEQKDICQLCLTEGHTARVCPTLLVHFFFPPPPFFSFFLFLFRFFLSLLMLHLVAIVELSFFRGDTSKCGMCINAHLPITHNYLQESAKNNEEKKKKKEKENNGDKKKKKKKEKENNGEKKKEQEKEEEKEKKEEEKEKEKDEKKKKKKKEKSTPLWRLTPYAFQDSPLRASGDEITCSLYFYPGKEQEEWIFEKLNGDNDSMVFIIRSKLKDAPLAIGKQGPCLAPRTNPLFHIFKFIFE